MMRLDDQHCLFKQPFVRNLEIIKKQKQKTEMKGRLQSWSPKKG